MPPTSKFQLVVEAQARGEADLARLSATVNRLSSDLEKANTRIANSSANTQKRFTDSVKKMESDAAATGLSLKRSLQDPLGAVNDKLLAGSGSAAKFVGAIAGVAIGVGAAATAFTSLVREAGDAALEIKSLSQSTGLSIGQADKLRAAANLTGFDIRNLKEAALDLSVALKDTGGQGEQTRQLMRQLGVSAYTTSGQARQLGDVLLELFDAASKVQDVTQRVNLSRVFGGEDAAKNIQPLLTQYREANKLAAELGFGTRDGLLKALNESNQELRKFDLQWEIIKGKLAEKIAPIVVTVLYKVGQVASGDIKNLTTTAENRAAGDELVANLFPSIDPGAALGRLSPAVPAQFQSRIAAGAALGSKFRAGQLGTEDGIKLRLDQIAKDRTEITQKLASGALSPETFREMRAQLARLTGEGLSLQEQLQFQANARASATLQVNSGDFVSRNIGAEIRVSRAPSLRRRNADNFGIVDGATGSFVVTEADRRTFDAGAYNPGNAAFEAQVAKDRRERELNTSYAKQYVAFAERRIELLTGPGGELAAINQIYELKKAGLEQELQYGNEIFDLTERRQQLEQERSLRLLELQRQRREEARAMASDFVGSLQDGRPGDFFRREGSRLLNQVGTNALTGTFQRAQSTLGRIGASIPGAGKLFAGTLLDPANASAPVDRNTLATEQNTAAIDQFSKVITGMYDIQGATTNGGSSGFSIPGIPGILNGIPSSVFGGSGKNPLIFSAAPDTGGSFRPSYDVDPSGNIVPLATPGLSRSAKGIGIAGALVGGTLGAVSGIRQGGLSGALTATGSIAGTAATLLALSPAAGPAAPILAGVALGAMAISSLLPDPKKKRDREIDRMLSDAYYQEADPMAYNFDRLGRAYDTNRRGDIRSFGEMTININALDSKSVVDSRDSIADAVRLAMYEGHGINRAAQEVVLGA